MDMIFSLVLLLFVAISVVWSVFVRKLAKTRIQSICAIASVLIALIGTIVLKSVVIDPNFIKGTVLPMAPALPAEVMDLINASDLVLEFVVGLPVALISPLIFVVLYVVLRLLTGIIYLFIVIFAHKAIKNSKENPAPYAKARSIAWSAVSALLVLVVLLVPVAFYGSLVEEVADVVADMDVLDDETKGIITEVSGSYIKPLTSGTTVGLFRAVGGDAIIDELTSITVDGEIVYINEELNAVFTLAGNALPLAKDGAPGSYGEKEADSIVAVVEALTDSKILTTIASQAIVVLTEDMVNGEKDMPMADNELFGGLIVDTITIVHNDAEYLETFKADLTTVAKMASELIKGGVFANIDDTDALLDELAGGDTIKNVILALGENKNMKRLIPEVTNIGIKAIANAVEVKEDATAVYNELMNTIADDLNSVKELEDAEKVSALSPKLNSAFDHAGIVIDKQVINLYSVAMIQGIVNEAGNNEITDKDVQAFFAAYAGNGNNNAATVLASMIDTLSKQDVKSESYNAEDIANMLDAKAQAMLGTNEGALYDAIVGVKLKRNLDDMFVDKTVNPNYSYAIQKKFYTASTYDNTVALQSVEMMRERTLLIFMDDVVVDVDKIGDFDPEVEAEAIGGIFSQAGNLMSDLDGDINIGKMAGSVGSILNSLRDSESVGEERTTNLFIAIIQSSMVRDAANMDIGTATQLGVKGTAQNADGSPVDYEKTFKTISNTMDVLQNMNSSTEGGMEVTDLTTVLKDLNPQTAGMIESYITEERLTEDYGLDTEQSATAAPLISDVFGYMGSADMDEEACEREAEALDNVMTLVTNASDRANNGETTGQTVFGDDPNTSIMGKSAEDTVATFMASESLKYSLDNNSKNGTLDEDPFGMQDMMNEESEDKQQLLDAMKGHYEASEDKEKDANDLTNLGKLFGLGEDDMGYILGGNN